MISVITANYNCAKYIRRAYESLRSQSFADWEWVIVDDASTDCSLEIIADLVADSRVRLLRNSNNRGRGASRRRAIAAAHGDYIAILDMDDFFFSGRLAIAEEARRSGCVFQCSRMVIVDGTLMPLSVRPARTGRYLRSFAHGTLACRTEVARAIGYSDSPRGQDQRIVITLANSFEGMFSEEILYGYLQERSFSVENAIRGNYTQAAEIARAVWRGAIEPGFGALLQAGDCLAKATVLTAMNLWSANGAATLLTERHLKRERVVIPLQQEIELRELARF